MLSGKKIRVLVVDDSMLFRKLLIDNLSQKPMIQIAGYAVDAFDAQNKIAQLKPDVVTCDVEMPRMSGIDFVKRVLPKYPVPIILVSSLNLSVFDALQAGAVDFVRKPDMTRNNNVASFINGLAGKISIASRAKVRVPGTASALPTMPKGSASLTCNMSALSQNNTVIAIGASTGGSEATLEVVRNLPANTPGIVVTQHMPEGFTKMYAERLNRICKMEAKEAENGDKIQKGRILVAPGNLQMRVVRVGVSYTVSCASGPKVSGHRPSVDVLFQSMASSVGKNGIGIILTGMGKDGAAGLLEMRKRGAYTIGQDKDSCVVYGMPMVAHNIGAVCQQASCANIANVLLNHLNKL